MAGSGFVSGSTTVDFGSNAGTSVDVTNSGSLTVVVPAGSGTVSVSRLDHRWWPRPTPLANAYTYDAAADGHRGHPEQRAPRAGTNTVTVAGSRVRLGFDHGQPGLPTRAPRST